MRRSTCSADTVTVNGERVGVDRTELVVEQRRGEQHAIGLMTPAAVHAGTAPALHAARAAVLDAAYAQHPDRFVRKPPVPPELPTAAWINKPAATKEATAH